MACHRRANSEVPNTVLVTGAAGALGKRVSCVLAAKGMTVVGFGRGRPPASWQHRWISDDVLATGSLLAAVRDVDSIVHCATDPMSPERDIDMVRRVVEVAASSELHLVHVSIAGIEEAGLSRYYAAKLEGERLLRASGIAHALIRSTQFHPFVLSVLRRLDFGPLLLCPPFRLQPIDPDHVAETIGRCVSDRTVGTKTLSGPERLTVSELADAWPRLRHAVRLRLPIPAIGPLAAMSAIRAVEGQCGGRSWQEWLGAYDGS